MKLYKKKSHFMFLFLKIEKFNKDYQKFFNFNMKIKFPFPDDYTYFSNSILYRIDKKYVFYKIKL